MENCDETSDSIIPEAFIEFIDATVGCVRYYKIYRLYCFSKLVFLLDIG